MWRLALIEILFLAAVAPSVAQMNATVSGVVTGKVVDSEGAPVAGAIIEVRGPGVGALGEDIHTVYPIGHSVSGAGGVFEIPISRTASEVMARVKDISTTVGVNARSGDIVIRLNRPLSRASREAMVAVNDLAAPPKAQAEMKQAREAYARHDATRALDALEQAMKAAPSWGDPYELRGAIRLEAGNYDGADGDLNFALKANPKNVNALVLRARLYRHTGKLDLAAVNMQSALALPPVAWTTYFEAANLDMARHNFAEVVKLGRDTLACTPPGPPEAHFLMGEAEFAQSHWAEARHELELYLKLVPADEKNAASEKLAREHLNQIPASN